MSYAWGFLKTEKQSIIAGSVIVGLFVSLFIGLAILKISDYYELNLHVLVGILFIIIVFPCVTYFTYKMVSKKKTKK